MITVRLLTLSNLFQGRSMSHMIDTCSGLQSKTAVLAISAIFGSD
ncbi:hypothetical protein ALP99_01812 [Pseudomonas syringae pv. tomato]|uniref:Uncharacterized protein n=1 Tax=Pseudomonas syringae pv. tomato TaxID=323 RepID=A0AAQ0SLF1_PSEUB|nr:hypothetical protein PSTA9_04253 [Pseudomonas syringae pv. tomato]KUR50020.1 hypothetical protein PST407_01540 [Pseudomonas syringae pv. tomato]RMQ67974.1 hypothetical protein ALQ00_00982 [Pseudomonas syringae pv. tomato]RMQ68317.1 hypothetical protein ALP99_01812 [Pseudomonas syringae pv. tomato]CAI9008402.1 hypothetical protein DAPPPG215_29540 [Pseudomonas syringae pv. tomato]